MGKLSGDIEMIEVEKTENCNGKTEEDVCKWINGQLRVCSELKKFLPVLSKNPIGFSKIESRDGGKLKLAGIGYTPKGSKVKYPLNGCPFCMATFRRDN
jgi:hypothetical protein